jgi:hypothetical protein
MSGDLGGVEDLRAIQTRVAQGLPACRFVSVRFGRIDVAVSNQQGFEGHFLCDLGRSVKWKILGYS